MARPTMKHWQLVKRIMRYLAGTKKQGIQYARQVKEKDKALTAYADSSYGDDLLKGKSTTGSIIFFGTGPVYWQSKRQEVVALSTTEAELIALNKTCKEVMWLIKMMTEAHLPQQLPIPVGEDNSGCVETANNPSSRTRVRHVRVQYHYVQELVKDGYVEVIKVPTDDMPADILTKPLGKAKTRNILRMIMTD